jgi:hypothetical protein
MHASISGIQGWYAPGLLPDAVTKRVELLDELLAERQRDRGDVTIFLAPYPHPCTFELVQQYRDYAADVNSLEDSLRRYAKDIVRPAETS